MSDLKQAQNDRGRAATARAKRKLAASGAIGASLLCGLLIWAKLRLVTDIPRTAYAAPEARSKAVADPTTTQSGISHSENQQRPDNAPD
ncbi:MAG: hypothetical protein KF912_13460 [Phycisphaeraceae bacterium]|nr:hypothetical protein [Phycisphaeraceae bacterium]QYK48900.1 MAG: hypothetical protein KF838_03395 [Phycisphaeraceae bacterium]